jgi:hypothetical protein
MMKKNGDTLPRGIRLRGSWPKKEQKVKDE